jgi:hypothetical protein
MLTNPYISGELVRERRRELTEQMRQHRLARQLSAGSGTTPRRGRVVLTLAAAIRGVGQRRAAAV